MEFSQAPSCRDGPGRGPSPEPPLSSALSLSTVQPGHAPTPLWLSDFLMHQDGALLLDSMTCEACRAVSSVKTRGHEGTGREGERRM